jgi:nucleoside-diphosphate-sugar epimerase
MWWSLNLLVAAVLTTTASSGRTVLITGGAGFLGRHFTHRFCQAGWQVTVVDSLRCEDALSPEQWPLHLRCPVELLQFIHEDYLEYFNYTDSSLDEGHKQEWTIFLHLATAHDRSYRTGSAVAGKENLVVDNAAFQWAIADQTNRVIVKMMVVTSTVLGLPQVLSKQTDRSLAPALHRSHRLNVAQYEAQYIFGEDQSVSGVLRDVLQQVMARKDPIVLDQDANADFIFVEDVVQGVFLSFNQVHDGSVVSLVSGQHSNMSTITRVIAQQLQHDPVISVNQFLDDDDDDDDDDDLSLSFPGHTTQVCPTTKRVGDVVAHWIALQQEEQQQEREKERVEKETLEQAPPRYSSFQCSGGNQEFPDMKPFNNDSLSKKNKVCKLENVCLYHSKIMYFQHPEEAAAPAFVRVQKHNMVKVGLTQDLASGIFFHLNVVPGSPLPSHFELSDSKTWFFILASLSDAVSHHLLDDLYPVLAAMDLFGVPHEDVALVYSGCELLDFYHERCAYDPFRTRGEVCHENFQIYSQLVFDTHPVSLRSILDESDIKCFKSLVVGQNYVFNVDTVDKQRAVTLRKGRDLIIKNIDSAKHVGDKLDVPEDNFLILILPKSNPGFQGDGLWSTMCEDVHVMLQQLHLANVVVVCNPSGSLGREAEISLINRAALIIAEHGTLSLLAAFYGSDGTVLITVGSNEAIKNAETLPFALHLYVLYTTIERMDSMASLVRYGVHLAATNRKYVLEYYNYTGSESLIYIITIE